MSYDFFNNLKLVGLGLAGVFLIVSILLFFVLKIPSVVGYLSGTTAKKAIEAIRSGNSAASSKRKGASARLMTTAEMSETAKQRQMKTGGLNQDTNTDNLDEKYKRDHAHDSIEEDNKTKLLDENSVDNSAAANQNQGTVVTDSLYTEQTTVLGDETGVLYKENIQSASDFRIRVEISLFVSHEVIT